MNVSYPHRSKLERIPDWLLQKALAGRTQSTINPREALGELDTPEAIARAKDFLEHDAPEAIEGSGGDTTTFKVACAIRDFGLSEETIYDLLLDWNEHKASPPWSADDLRQKARNASTYATLPAGVSNAKDEFGVVDIGDAPKPKKPKLPKIYPVQFHAGAKQALATMSDPLIKSVLNSGALSCLYGKSNSGKTFVALDMAFHIATGKPWQGHLTKPGLVVYVAAEGGRGIFKRLAALRNRHEPKEKVPFYVVPCPVSLLGRENDSQLLVDIVRDCEKDTGQKVVLIVIDTLSRALSGGDENSSTDMGEFIKQVDRIREATGSHLMLVHHAGKDAAKGARGWSGITGAIDTEIEVRDGKLTITKQRDVDPVQPMRFALVTSVIGQDSDGDDVTSCTVSYQAEAEFNVALTPREKEVLVALKKLAAEQADRDGNMTEEATLLLSTIEIMKESNRFLSKPVTREALTGLMKGLKEKGQIENPQRGQWVIPI